jgi:hypothetical protein
MSLSQVRSLICRSYDHLHGLIGNINSIVLHSKELVIQETSFVRKRPNLVEIAIPLPPSLSTRNYLLEATFGITLIVPADLTAFSNMPKISNTHIAGGNKKVVFDISPKMSTYLLPGSLVNSIPFNPRPVMWSPSVSSLLLVEASLLCMLRNVQLISLITPFNSLVLFPSLT